MTNKEKTTMSYSIDYPDHELAKFIGQTFMRRSPLDRVRFGIISGIEKVYDHDGRPYELLIHLANNDTFAIFNNSIELNNPNYTINGVPIGVKPHETQEAFMRGPRASSNENSFRAFYVHCGWDTDISRTYSRDNTEVSAESYLKALESAILHFKTNNPASIPDRFPHIIENPDKLTARWYSDDACEELGSQITITIERVK
jgi:hypothetical protein